MKSIILLLLLFITFNNAGAQSSVLLRGFVSDSTNGEALAFCNLTIKESERGVTTNTKGYFLITSLKPNNHYTLFVSYIGYQSKEITFITNYKAPTVLNIKLAPSSVSIETVEKIEKRLPESNVTDISLTRITIKELEKLPQSVEPDIFRALQNLPGVQSVGDVSANFSVRGSPSSQNLFLINNIIIYYPFHAIGLFSAVDPEMVNNVEFYKGGFTSEYSGRLSSVIKLNTKDGNKYKFGGTANGSLLTGKLLLEGPITNGSYIVTARQSYNNKILNNFFDGKSVPASFYDASFKINYSNNVILKNGKFSLFGYTSNDNLTNNNEKQADYKWSNTLLGLRWLQLSDEPLYYEVDLAISNFSTEVIPNLSRVRYKKNTLRDFKFSMNFKYIFDNKDELNVGLNIQEVASDLFLQNLSGGVGNLSGTKGANISVFSKYKFLQFDKFGLDLGTRLNLTRMSGTKTDNNVFEPRISFSYNPTKNFFIKAAWGIYNQETITLVNESELNNVFEPWFITPSYLNPSKSIHYIAGIDYKFSTTNFLKLETYYKDLVNFAVLNDQKFFDTDHDLINASGESFGGELSYSWTKKSFKLFAAYTLSWTTNTVKGKTYSPKYDSRNILNFLFEYNFGNGWRSSLNWNYYSGLPYTKILSYESKLSFSDILSNQDILNNYNYFANYGNLNAERMPDYHRMDFGISKFIKIKNLDVYIYLNLINVYNRKNIYYYDVQTKERINMLPFLPTASIKVKF